MTVTFTYDSFQDKHLSGALRMSADVSWPHRREDWAFVAGISNGVVAMQGEQVVATAFATPFGSVAMANLIIVDAALRGRGLGRDIMGRAMNTANPYAWQLVATKEGVPLYEKLGFEAFGEIVQHQGPVRATDAPNNDNIQWATADDMDQVRAMDLEATCMDRGTLYDVLAREARFAVLRQDGVITGFAAVRPFGRGEVAGPVIAANLTDAQSLLSEIMCYREGKFLRVDTDRQSGLAPWLEQHGLAHAGGGLQMQKGTRPERPATSLCVFALASQALG